MYKVLILSELSRFQQESIGYERFQIADCKAEIPLFLTKAYAYDSAEQRKCWHSLSCKIVTGVPVLPEAEVGTKPRWLSCRVQLLRQSYSKVHYHEGLIRGKRGVPGQTRCLES
ncbi:hypothetical protein GJ744_008366 [Endocarpon pusillum]|uniref:Uncharacterized protein n=1 Tax=Endocarpon pusillum TaxID=364733 RepID=A0A8H7E3G1_9EURO|nr:hypothetical protein GJ744_008366 [Endocarpon pusillum]